MTDFFENARPGVHVTRGGASFELPILYFRDDMFALFYTAELDRVRALMPSDRLSVVTVAPGRALVGIAAFNYIDTSIGPYGEVAVVVPCVYDRPALPLLPAIMEARYPGFGNLVLHLPVTTAVARDAGRGEWGYTKFVADMQFANTPDYFQCRVREGGHEILTMRVAKQGLVMSDNKPLVTFSVRDRALIKTSVPQRGIVRNALRPKKCHLELGDHEVARSLAALNLSARPVMSRYYLQRSGVLPAGEILETGVRPLDGYRGADREGELAIDYM